MRLIFHWKIKVSFAKEVRLHMKGELNFPIIWYNSLTGRQALGIPTTSCILVPDLRSAGKDIQP